MMVIVISIATCIATLLGGIFAFRFVNKLHLILAFSAGTVLGVAFFDLLPESLSLSSSAYGNITITGLCAIAFFAYMMLDGWALLHVHKEGLDNHHENRGRLGAGSFSLHSLFDGLAIGFGFQAPGAVGYIIALAVLSHDFSDGINTVSVLMKEKVNKKEAISWLIIDAVTPVIGAVITLFFKLPASILGLFLAIFCGFFIYIGATDMLPESRSKHHGGYISLLTIAGAALLYLVSRLV